LLPGSAQDFHHPGTRQPEGPESVLEFWFGDGLRLGWPSDNRSKLWWGGGPELDETVNTRFGGRVHEALAEALQCWANEPLSRLALVILLDQFTRNVFRGKARAFSGDAMAQSLVMQALDMTMDQRLPWVGRMFLYMPLMHAENLTLQDECVKRFTALQAEVPQALKQTLDGNLKFALEHRDIIAEFGRFPYRNQALGRLNSPEEDGFLKHGPRFGQ
jgi:uncharacterized protein (DUF924 family)